MYFESVISCCSPFQRVHASGDGGSRDKRQGYDVVTTQCIIVCEFQIGAKREPIEQRWQLLNRILLRRVFN